MVTVEEYSQQLAQRRVQLEAAKKQAEEFIVSPARSQQELRAQTRDRKVRPTNALQERAKRKEDVRTRGIKKEKVLADIETAEDVLSQQETEYEQSLAESQAQQTQQQEASQQNLALRVYLGQASGGSKEFQAIPESIKRAAQKQAEGMEQKSVSIPVLKTKQKIEEIVPVDVKVDLKKAKVVIDPKTKERHIEGGIDYSQFESLSQTDLKKLEKEGIVELKQVEKVEQMSVDLTQVPGTQLMSLLPTEKVVGKPKQIGLPDPWFKRQVSGVTKGVEKYYGKLFGTRTLDSGLKGKEFAMSVAGDIGKAGIITLPTIIKKGTEKTIEFGASLLPEKGLAKYKVPETSVPQRVTIGGEYKIPEQEVKIAEKGDIFIKDVIAKGAGLGAEVGYYTILPVAGIFAGGAAVLSSPTTTREEKITGGIFAGLAGGSIFLKSLQKAVRPKLILKEKIVIPKKILDKPKVTVSPQELKISTDIETGKTKVQEIYSVVTGAQRTKKGKIVEVTTGIRELFGRKPIYSGYPYGGKQYVAEGLGRVKDLKPSDYQKAIKAIVKRGYTEKQAKELIKFSAPESILEKGKGQLVVETLGESKPVAYLKDFKTKITPTKGEVGGVPLRKPEGLVKFVKSGGVEIGEKEGISLIKGVAEERKAYVGKAGQVFSKVKQAGKTTEVFEYLSKVKPVKETDTIQQFLQKTVFQKTIPRSRKILTAEADVLVKKGDFPIKVIDETISKAEAVGIKFVGKKTPLEKTYGSLDVKAIQKLLPRVIPPTGITKAPTTLVKPTTSLKGIPRMVGGAGLTEEQLAARVGKAEYDALGVPTTKPVTGVVGGADIRFEELSVKELPSITVPSMVTQTPFQETAQITVQQPKIKMGVGSLIQPLEREVVKQKELLIQKPAQKQKAIVIQLLKETQKPRQRQEIISVTKPRVTKPTPPTKPTKIKVPFDLPTSKQTMVELAEEIVEGYGVFGKVKGKDIRLGKFKTQRKAERKLKSFLKTTLGASGKVTKGEKPIAFGKLKSFGEAEFRPAKRDITRVVQRKEYRLGTKPETKSIQYFRKGKGASKWI